MNSILPDVYSMIQDDNELVKDLIQIRRIVSRMNSKIRELAGLYGDPAAWGLGPYVEAHNKEMESYNGVLLPTIDRVIEKLETRYNLKRPFWGRGIFLLPFTVTQPGTSRGFSIPVEYRDAKFV